MKSPVRGMARSWRSVGRIVAVGVVGLASMGCEASDEPMTEVWGKVRYHGEPIRSGVVVMAPAGGGSGSWGIGVIKPNGAYHVISSPTRVPMTAGRYNISFRRSPPLWDSAMESPGVAPTGQDPREVPRRRQPPLLDRPATIYPPRSTSRFKD